MGKNESNVLCPALYRKETTQMVATAVTKPVPKGHTPSASASRAPPARAAAAAEAVEGGESEEDTAVVSFVCSVSF